MKRDRSVAGSDSCKMRNLSFKKEVSPVLVKKGSVKSLYDTKSIWEFSNQSKFGFGES